jgi:hypothetical protein
MGLSGELVKETMMSAERLGAVERGWPGFERWRIEGACVFLGYHLLIQPEDFAMLSVMTKFTLCAGIGAKDARIAPAKQSLTALCSKFLEFMVMHEAK